VKFGDTMKFGDTILILFILDTEIDIVPQASLFLFYID